MDEIRYLRMEIDVVVFEGGQRLARRLVEEGGIGNVGGSVATRLNDAISRGDIEIDDARKVEDHTT